MGTLPCRGFAKPPQKETWDHNHYSFRRPPPSRFSSRLEVFTVNQHDSRGKRREHWKQATGILARELGGRYAVSQCDGFVKSFAQNYTVVNEGDEVSRIYMVNEGLLRAFRFMSDGRRQITHFLFPNDFVGLIDGDRCPENVETVMTTKLTSLSQVKTQKFIQNKIIIQEALHNETKNLLRRSHTLQIILGRLAPIEKLSCFILLLHERSPEAELLNIPMPRQDIADFLGITIETVSRSFTRLRKLGLIAVRDPSTIEICSLAKLQQVAGTKSHTHK